MFKAASTVTLPRPERRHPVSCSKVLPRPPTHHPCSQADARFSNTYPRVTSLWIAAIIATTSIPTVRLRLSSAFDVQGCQIDANTTTGMAQHRTTTCTLSVWL